MSFGIEELKAKCCKTYSQTKKPRRQLLRLTSEDRGLEQLYKFVNLDEQGNSHFQIGAEPSMPKQCSEETVALCRHMPYKICKRFAACSYACARRQREKAATALCDHDRYRFVNKT